MDSSLKIPLNKIQTSVFIQENVERFEINIFSALTFMNYELSRIKYVYKHYLKIIKL